LHRDAADRVTPPLWLTKRGCVVYASKRQRRFGWIGIVGRDEVPDAIPSDDLPSFVGLQPVVV
jgi:hypothetical protein